MDAGSPCRWTGITAPVRGPSASASRLGSMHLVSGSTSTSTGRAPVMLTASTVAMNVSAGVTTSRPGPTPSASSAMRSAFVPSLRPTQCRVPQ